MNNNIVDPKIRKKLQFFTFMFVLSICLSILFTVKDIVPFKLILISFLGGFLIGAIISRIQKISWDNHSDKIIKEFDIISGILLFFLILFIIFKEQIIHSFINFPKISAIIFALNAGIMLGRIIKIRMKIYNIIRNHKE